MSKEDFDTPASPTEQLPASGNAERFSRHKDYWLSPDFSIFQVREGTRFRIPSYQFTNGSSVFAGMYSLPQAPGGHDVVIELPDVTAQDFSSLAKVLYPLQGNFNVPTDEWIVVLKLATKWFMLDVRAQAILQLSKSDSLLSPLQKVELGRDLKVSEWFIEGCREFVTRDEFFTEKEVTALSIPLATHLLRIREERWRGSHYRQDLIYHGHWRTRVTEILTDNVKDIKLDEESYSPR